MCVAACDNCVIVLLEDLDKLEETLVSVSAQLSSLNASSMAWTQLQSLNRTVEDVAVRARTHTVLCRPHTVIQFYLATFFPMIPEGDRELQQQSGRQPGSSRHVGGGDENHRRRRGPAAGQGELSRIIAGQNPQQGQLCLDLCCVDPNFLRLLRSTE